MGLYLNLVVKQNLPPIGNQTPIVHSVISHFTAGALTGITDMYLKLLGAVLELRIMSCSHSVMNHFVIYFRIQAVHETSIWQGTGVV
jgi:hypothetical protein